MGEAAKTVHQSIVTYTSMLSLLSLSPLFVILLWYTMVHADGSILQTYEYWKHHGLQGLKDIWSVPTTIAWKIIACFGAFEALLRIALPGTRFEGPVSPSGNIPVYKANGLQAYAVTLITYLSLWWFGLFDPAIVYDHLGEIYAALVMGSLIFCILLYIKGHLAPSSSDSGSSGNPIIDFYWGMELYPRIGKSFDIKVFTNCRFGMMSWAVLAVTYCIKQMASSSNLPSDNRDDEYDKLILDACVVVATFLGNYVVNNCLKQSKHKSGYRGWMWIRDVLGGHEELCQDMFRMEKRNIVAASMAIHNFIKKHMHTDAEFLEYELNEELNPEASTKMNLTIEGEEELFLNQTCAEMVALRDSIHNQLVEYHCDNA